MANSGVGRVPQPPVRIKATHSRRACTKFSCALSRFSSDENTIEPERSSSDAPSSHSRSVWMSMRLREMTS